MDTAPGGWAANRPSLSSSPPLSDPDPVIEADKAGIDRTLLRANIARTPTERVQNLMALQRLAAEARAAGQRLRTPPSSI